MYIKEYDVVVVGAGHAGLEAACAAARLGVKVLLVTKKAENLGEMSCNPAIGGVAKGTIVKEIDALDGVMAKATDMAGIHFRILNASKGPAVHSPRAQADRKLYKKAVNQILENYQNLEVAFGSVEDILIEDGKVVGVVVENTCHSDSQCHVERSETSHETREILRCAQDDKKGTQDDKKGVQDDNQCHVERSETSHETREILRCAQDDKKGTQDDKKGVQDDNQCHVERSETSHEDKLKIINCSSVVLTTGTFLRGMIHIGDKKTPAGRVDEEPSYGLSATLEKHNFKLSRLKTGTPPRILKSSIDFSKLEEQAGDNPAIPFSYLNEKISVPQISCFITYTNKKTHEVIQNNLHKSAMYGGHIEGVGPRYCPSIEDKIHRFADKERHQIFLEPEGLDSDLVYPNGISTSLPQDVQIEFLKTIEGLENCVVTQAGYAIEYDFVDPRELLQTLETKKIKNLFFAGQINGTTGYEEAAGQGIVAGINAALKTKKSQVNNSAEEFILDRSNSYIGVMIDDLTTLGTSEPYRMLTSRAEYRLSLRADNADFRLTEMGIKIGCVKEQRALAFLERKEKVLQGSEFLERLKISPNKLANFGVMIKQDGIVRSALQLLSFPNISFDILEKIWPEISAANISAETKKQIAINAIYSSYLKRQENDLAIFQKDSNMKIPLDIDYGKIQSLSNEVREKLNKLRPTTIAAAFRVQGITPASMMAVMVYIKKGGVG